MYLSSSICSSMRWNSTETIDDEVILSIPKMFCAVLHSLLWYGSISSCEVHCVARCVWSSPQPCRRCNHRTSIFPIIFFKAWVQSLAVASLLAGAVKGQVFSDVINKSWEVNRTERERAKEEGGNMYSWAMPQWIVRNSHCNYCRQGRNRELVPYHTAHTRSKRAANRQSGVLSTFSSPVYYFSTTCRFALLSRRVCTFPTSSTR